MIGFLILGHEFRMRRPRQPEGALRRLEEVAADLRRTEAGAGGGAGLAVPAGDFPG
jgi:hypothetical protein